MRNRLPSLRNDLNFTVLNSIGLLIHTCDINAGAMDPTKDQESCQLLSELRARIRRLLK
jgi:hypothetical protein